MLEVGKEEKERDRLFRHSVITDYLVYQAWVTKVSAQITIKNKRKPMQCESKSAYKPL